MSDLSKARAFLAWLFIPLALITAASGCDREETRADKHVQAVFQRLKAIERKPSAVLLKLRQEYEQLRRSKAPDVGQYALLVLLGQAYTLDGSYDKSLEHYREAQKLLPNVADAYYAMGDAYYELVLVEPAIDRTYRFDSPQPAVPIQSRDRAQALLTAALRQYETAHRHKTFDELHPSAPRKLTSKTIVQQRAQQVKDFINSSTYQMVLLRSDAPKLRSWAIHFNPPANVGDKNTVRAVAPERPIPDIMAEIQSDLTIMMKAVSSHTRMKQKAADYRKKNQSGIDDMKRRVTRDPEDAAARFALGYVYMIQLDYDLAVKEYQEGCELLATALDCWAGLSRVLYNVAVSYLTTKGLCNPLPPKCDADPAAQRVLTAGGEILEIGADKLPLNTRWERGRKLLSAASNQTAVATLRDDIRMALQ